MQWLKPNIPAKTFQISFKNLKYHNIPLFFSFRFELICILLKKLGKINTERTIQTYLVNKKGYRTMNILYCGDKPMQKGILLSSMSLVENVDEPLNIYIITVDYREKGVNYKPVDKVFAEYLKKELNKSDIDVNVYLLILQDILLRNCQRQICRQGLLHAVCCACLLIRQILMKDFFTLIQMCFAEEFQRLLLSGYGGDRDCGSF